MEGRYKIDTTDPKNRKVISTTKIPKFTKIFASDPLVTASFSGNRDRYCEVCLKRGEKLSKCSACGSSYYCSADCQRADWPQHKLECKLFNELRQKKYTVTNQFIMLLRIYFQIQKGNKALKECVDQLISNKGLVDSKRLEFFESIAIALIKYLDLDLSKKDEIIAEMVDLGCKIAMNAFTIFGNDYDAISSALYFPTNFLNHSCDPNCLVVYQRKNQRVFALRDIEEGEELTISYIEKENSLQKRRDLLKESYCFTCECKRCKDEEEKSMSSLVTEQKLKSEQLQKELQNAAKIEELLLAKEKEILEASLDLREFQEQLSSYYIQKGDYQKAYDINRVILKKMLRCYDKAEPVVGWKYFELAKLADCNGQLVKVKKNARKAITILEKYYDSGSPELEEIRPYLF